MIRLILYCLLCISEAAAVNVENVGNPLKTRFSKTDATNKELETEKSKHMNDVAEH